MEGFMRKQRNPLSMSRGGHALVLLVVVLASVSFGLMPRSAAGQADAAAAKALVPDMVGDPLAVFPAGALHVVGQDRFAIGLVDMATGPIEHGQVDLLFFKLTGGQGTLTETLPAPFMDYGVSEAHMAMDEHAEESEITGVYIARPTFDTPGSWGVVARLTLPDGTKRAGQVDFTVETDTEVPGVGESAIPSHTLTAATPEEAKTICTADPPDDMHALSLDEALTSGKPTVVLFATPALCTSRTCGPSLEAMQELEHRYGEQANFIHVEIYPERDYNKPVAAMDEWHLPSEPWLFLIDGQGKVVDRYEGGIGLTELDPAVTQLVS
jgi:hypothetical protein